MNHSNRQFGPLLCLLALSTATGCAVGKSEGWLSSKSLDVRRVVGLKKDEPEPPLVPTRLVSTWQDAVYNQVGKQSQRGFGGRLLFFNQESEDPIRVAGQLVVYAYDENGREAHETHPTRRYVFPADQFARHESDCKLGTSYSVWLPWDQTGGEQKNISLIARFEPQGGPLIAGDQTRHLLPGTRQLASGETAPPVEQVSDIRLTEYTQESELQVPETLALSKTKPAVTSIALSQKSWEKRLALAQSEAAKHAEATSTAEPQVATR